MLLYLHTHFNCPGGGSVWVLETASRLSKRKMDVKVLSQGADKKIIKPYKNIKFEFFGGPPTNSLKHWLFSPYIIKRIFNKIDEINPDIIFPQSFPATHWAFLYKKKNPDVKCVWMCQEPMAFAHDMDKILSLRWDLKYVNFAVHPLLKYLDVYLVRKYADQILTNSINTYNNAKRIYNRKSTIVNVGVDVKKFKPTKKKKNFVFFASRLTKFKRADVAIRTMKYLKDYKDLKLCIGAGGEEEDNLKKLTKDLGVENNVEFLGWISQKELQYYYSKSIATIFMSVNEPCGLVPLESMASGTPAIATYTGGPKETIINGKTGFFVPPNNPKAVADKIKLIYTNKRLLNRMSKDSRKHIENNFTWDIVVDKLCNVFERYY